MTHLDCDVERATEDRLVLEDAEQRVGLGRADARVVEYVDRHGYEKKQDGAETYESRAAHVQGLGRLDAVGFDLAKIVANHGEDGVECADGDGRQELNQQLNVV
jgi:hypothetical protein